jgi:hypothetical protein
MHHVAILHSRYLDAILEGCKVVESRLSLTRCAPFGRVMPGDTIHFKEMGAGFRAAAQASGVMTFEDLRPADVRMLARRYGTQIGADASYWEERAEARYATFVWLSEVKDASSAPSGFATTAGARTGWYVLDKVKADAARRSA